LLVHLRAFTPCRAFTPHLSPLPPCEPAHPPPPRPVTPRSPPPLHRAPPLLTPPRLANRAPATPPPSPHDGGSPQRISPRRPADPLKSTAAATATAAASEASSTSGDPSFRPPPLPASRGARSRSLPSPLCAPRPAAQATPATVWLLILTPRWFWWFRFSTSRFRSPFRLNVSCVCDSLSRFLCAAYSLDELDQMTREFRKKSKHPIPEDTSGIEVKMEHVQFGYLLLELSR
jgi:hypothetical protein